MAKNKQSREHNVTKQQRQAAYQQKLAAMRPFVMPETDKKLVASLGYFSAFPDNLSGYFKSEDWQAIYVDIAPEVKPDIACPLDAMTALPDASMDAVWLGHVLERFTQAHSRRIIREALRVLKEGGEFLAAVPDMQMAATYIAHSEDTKEVYPSSSGSITAMDMLFGHQQSITRGMGMRQHKYGFTAESLGLFLRENGVSNLRIQRKRADILAHGFNLSIEHPERVEKIVLLKEETPPTKAPPPLSRVAPQSQAVRYADVLDAPPQRWTPLNLKKS